MTRAIAREVCPRCSARVFHDHDDEGFIRLVCTNGHTAGYLHPDGHRTDAAVTGTLPPRKRGPKPSHERGPAEDVGTLPRLTMRALPSHIADSLARDDEAHSDVVLIRDADRPEQPTRGSQYDGYRPTALRLNRAEEGTPALSARELDILGHIVEDCSNRQIARALDIAEKTVKNHVLTITRKLGVHSRTGAAVLAIRTGLVGSDGEIGALRATCTMQDTALTAIRAALAQMREGEPS